MFEVCGYSHITRESELFEGRRRWFIGGPSYFLSIVLKRLGTSTKVITKLSKNDMDLLHELFDLGVEVDVLESSSTSSFHTIYGRSWDERRLTVSSVAQPFTVDDIKCKPSKYLYVGPLTTEDFDLSFLEKARSIAPVVIDVQGFTRKVSGDKIAYVDWSWKNEGLKYIDVLKADIAEATMITGKHSPKSMLESLASYGLKEILVTSNDGLYVYASGEYYFAPFSVDNIYGRVGRGDTSLGAYLHYRLGGFSPEQSTASASAATSIKMTYQGPFRSTAEDVMKLLATNKIVPRKF